MNTPYVKTVHEHHKGFISDVEFGKDRDGWSVASPLDLATRVCLLIADSVVSYPLFAIASAVEGLLRALFGSGLYLLWLLPFEGSQKLSKMGSKLLFSSLGNFGLTAAEVLAIPFTIVMTLWFSGAYLWDTSFGSKAKERSAPFIKRVMRSAHEEESWVNTPCFARASERHDEVVDDLDVHNDGKTWKVTSPLDLISRLSLASIDSIVASPLLALANLVEPHHR